MKLLRPRQSISLTHSPQSRRNRDHLGRIVSFHRSSPSHRRHRVIDLFRFPVSGIVGYVRRIEYDPNRNVPVCLVYYRNGLYSYVLHFPNCKVGDLIFSFAPIDRFRFIGPWSLLDSPRKGCSFPLRYFPTGSYGHAFQTGLGFSHPSTIALSCGSRGQILRFKGSLCLVRLRNGTLLFLPSFSMAVFGPSSSFNTSEGRVRKAGSLRVRGRRPHVRGVAKNPVDHPHGGGEGRSSGGRPSVSPWGILSKCGYRRS